MKTMSLHETAEAYKSGDMIAVVHRREDGQVYYHTQREEDQYVLLTSFYQMSEKRFDQLAQTCEPYDVRRLPALQEEKQ